MKFLIRFVLLLPMVVAALAVDIPIISLILLFWYLLSDNIWIALAISFCAFWYFCPGYDMLVKNQNKKKSVDARIL